MASLTSMFTKYAYAGRTRKPRITYTSSKESQHILREKVLGEYYCGNFQSVFLKECRNDKINKDRIWLGSLLECAVQWGKQEMIDLLVQKFQVNINYDCKNSLVGYESALIAAIRWNNMVEDLIKMGADVNIVTDVTPLTEACRRGNLNVVKLLLDKGAKVNITTTRGYSPLMAASCAQGDQGVEIVKCLLNHGADFNLLNQYGRTALHEAVVHGNVQAVKMLLECRAEILQDKAGFTPLLLAVNYKKGDIFDLFQSSQCVPTLDKVNALEHKAASPAPDDMEGVFQLLHQAMETRCEDTSDVLRKPVREPVAAFGNVCESQTLEELEARKDMKYELLMECLAVEDRLLGCNSICLANNFFKIWITMYDEGLYDRTLPLVNYAIEAYSKRKASKLLSS